MKKILGIYRNQSTHWVGDGFPVKNLFSYDRLTEITSPFIHLDYGAPYRFAPSPQQRGVGSHPHRGFETVTIAYQGEVTHKDSHGGGGTIKSGDVQWMTAGSGMMHEELHSLEFTQKGGVLETIQLWVNLPSKNKMTEPKYQTISTQDIPVIYLDNHAGQLRIIAGQYVEQQGVASTFSPMNVWDGLLKANHEQTFQIPVGHNVLVVILEGEMLVNHSEKVFDSSIVIFDKNSDKPIQIKAIQDTKFLLLSGEPLNEPVQGSGPFVMNTKEEIIQAFQDFKQGKFGEIAVKS